MNGIALVIIGFISHAILHALVIYIAVLLHCLHCKRKKG